MSAYLGTMKDAGSDDLIPTGEHATKEQLQALSRFNRELFEENRKLRAQVAEVAAIATSIRKAEQLEDQYEHALYCGAPGMEATASERLRWARGAKEAAQARLLAAFSTAPSGPKAA